MIKIFKSLSGFKGISFAIRDVCTDFEPCLKAQNFVTIHPNITKPYNVTDLNLNFLVTICLFLNLIESAIQSSPKVGLEIMDQFTL